MLTAEQRAEHKKLAHKKWASSLKGQATTQSIHNARSEADAKKLRDRWHHDSEYRFAKLEASRKKYKNRTPQQRAKYAENLAAKRSRDRQRLRLRTSWQEILERPYVMELHELKFPIYIIERPGQRREKESWPLHDPAAAWIEFAASATSTAA